MSPTEQTRPSSAAEVATAAHAAGTAALVRLGMPQREAGGFAQAALAAMLPILNAGWVAESDAAWAEGIAAVRLDVAASVDALVAAAVAADRAARLTESNATDTVAVGRVDLQTLFDLAVGSLDFGSGFWDVDDVEAADRIATALGVDTASSGGTYAKRMPHAFKTGPYPNWCGYCGNALTDQRHQERTEEQNDEG